MSEKRSACLSSALGIYYRNIVRTTNDLVYWLAPTVLTQYVSPLVAPSMLTEPNLGRVLELYAGIACACMPATVKVWNHHSASAHKLMAYISTSTPFRSTFQFGKSAEQVVCAEQKSEHEPAHMNRALCGVGRYHEIDSAVGFQSTQPRGTVVEGATSTIYSSSDRALNF